MQTIHNSSGGGTRIRNTFSKLVAATVIAVSFSALVTRAATPVFSPGFAKWERWADSNGDTANIDTFAANLLDPAFRVADTNGVSTYVGSPRGAADNYGVRASVLFAPPTTGNYVFFMASDDQGYLYLSTDENPANKKRIAAQPQWSDQNQWIDPDAVSTTEVRSDTYSASEWSPANTINLTAGKRYYVELIFREGGGGDGSELYVKLASDPDPVNGAAPTGGDFIGGMVDPTGASVTITTQPANTTGVEGSTATLSVIATGTSPVSGSTVTYQWKKNGVSINGANAASYTTPLLKLSDNNTTYSCLAMVAGASVLSSNATLTVSADAIKPTILTVFGSDTFTNATVVFSEPVTPATATNKANYQLDGGLTVLGATAVDSTTVRLGTSRQTSGTNYNLTVNNVQDTAATPNTIQANSVKSFTALAPLPGGLKLEAFYNIPGTAVSALLTDQKYLDNAPDLVAYVTNFTSRLALPDNQQGLATRENYGGRLSGWLVPAQAGDYELFIRSDDAAQLYLSPDDNPTNAVQIAEETGCCGPFEDPGVATETSTPQTLAAGRRYYIYALWKEGGGGDYCDVAWRKVGDATPARQLPYISGSVLQALAAPGTFTPPTVTISSPSSGSSFDVGVPVTATATATATGGKGITRVEFYEQARLLGTATTSPYSAILAGLSADAHVIFARAYDSAGLTADSAPVSISVGAQVEKITLLAIDDKTTWRYDRTGRDLGTAWREKNYDDSTWPQGKTLIADETTTTVEPIRTPISRFNDNNEYVRTFYFRTHFNFAGAISSGVKLQLRHAVDDGVIFYLNGAEIHRFGIAANPVDYLSDAAGHENAYEGPYDLPISNLVQGDNVFAAEVHQSGGGSSDMVFGAELIATVPVLTIVTNLVAIDDKTVFRYDRTGRDLGLAWRANNYDDSAWPQGKTLIADETTTTVEPIRTPISRFNDNNEYVVTFYFRTHFTLDVAPSAVQKLRLRHAVDDGAVFYLNGTEIHRFGLADGAPYDYTTSFGGHENAYEGPYDISPTNLLRGDNVFAAEVHQSGTGSSDMVFGGELVATYTGGGGTTPTDPPRVTSVAIAGGTITIQWTGGGTLESAPSLSGAWTSTNDSDGSFSEAATGAGKYYRVKR